MPNLHHQCEEDGCYRDGLWDWEPFNDCFGDSGIRISDVDGIVERNGLFLMLDGKRVGRGGARDISDGQRRLYRQFANKGGHVLVFHGQPPVTVQYLREWLPGGQFVAERPCDLAGLKLVVADWYWWAEGKRTLIAEIHAADPPRPEGEWPDCDTIWPPDHPKYKAPAAG